MRSDPVLQWSLRARNVIVKEGDLNTMSRQRVTLVPDYDTEAASMTEEQVTWAELSAADPDSIVRAPIEAPVFLPIESVLDQFDALGLPLSVRSGASVVVERRWVDDQMPGYELLTLIAYAYGRLSVLLTSCHELLDLHTVRISAAQPPGSEEPEVSVEVLDGLPSGGRLPCMADPRRYRTRRYRLSDRSEVKEFRNWHAEFDPQLAEEVRSSGIYGEPPHFPRDVLGGMQTTEQLAALVKFYAHLARGVLLSGQEHGWFSYYFRRGHNVGARVHATVDTPGKHAVAEHIARSALELDADTVVMMSEAWMGPQQLTPDGAYVRPSLHPDRGEAFVVDAVAKSGARAGGYIPFHVTSGEPPDRKVAIGDYVPQPGASGILMTTLSAWGAPAAPLAGAAFWRAQRSR
jgi:hypothetical protein